MNTTAGATRHQARESGEGAEQLVHRAKLEPLTDGGVVTARLLGQALALDARHHEARVLRERLSQLFVPRWHFPMLADAGRNRAYAEAIAAKVRPGDIVLDIGCGAGLTAMLAARAGAKHVYTCERQPLIAEAAERVIADNGLSDRITVIPKMSHTLELGVDLPEPVDVVLSEIVDTVLLGEGALATLDHAMKTLAKPGARAIPETGRLLAQPIESEALMTLWRPARAEGFDLAAFHRFATVAQITPNDFATLGMRPLGTPRALFDFDFAQPDMRPGRTTLDLGCTHRGTVHAVMVFFEMTLAPGVLVTNGLHATGHWGRTAFLLDEPCSVLPGDQFVISAAHDTAHLSLSVEPDTATDPAKRPSGAEANDEKSRRVVAFRSSRVAQP